MTPLQIDLYKLFCKTTKLDDLEEGGSTDSESKLGNTTLAVITQMKKLCYHPELVFDKYVKMKKKNSKRFKLYS